MLCLVFFLGPNGGLRRPYENESEALRSHNLPHQGRRWKNHLQISNRSTRFLTRRSGRFCFYIQSGKVKVTVVSEQGKEAVVAILGPNEFCGEGCLAGQLRRMGTCLLYTSDAADDL